MVELEYVWKMIYTQIQTVQFATNSKLIRLLMHDRTTINLYAPLSLLCCIHSLLTHWQEES